MAALMPFPECVIGFLVRKQRFHAFHFKFHSDVGRKLLYHFFHGAEGVLLCVQGRADGGKEMGILRIYNMCLVQMQRSDERGLQFR